MPFILVVSLETPEFRREVASQIPSQNPSALLFPFSVVPLRIIQIFIITTRGTTGLQLFDIKVK